MSANQVRSSLPSTIDAETQSNGNTKLVSLFATASEATGSQQDQEVPTTIDNGAAPSSRPVTTADARTHMETHSPTTMHSPMTMQARTMHSPAHPHDPGQQHMHAALLDLVPHNRATHTAVKNGSWFDTSTWKEGKVPTNGARVLIEDGVSVTYNKESEARLESIRVDGTLKFASNADTKVLVDTFVVAPNGDLQIGSQRNPVGANFKTQVIFTADGTINRSSDPTLLGRGLISHGRARIYGADKADFLSLQAEAAAGDNVLVLNRAPQGWQVGDQIVLGGTQHRYGGSDADNSRFQDEELTIRKIDGNRVYFTNNDITTGDNTVLRFDHQRPDTAEKNQLRLYVANTTRNVTFETENADAVPTQQRAHIMFMHNPDVVVENAGFYNLGRSDKTKVVDDPGTNVDGSVGRGTNPRGRYGLHFHRNGAEDLTGTPAVARGNAVVGTPGWGIVHHDSYAVLENNVVFDVVGSGIVAESGNERGTWRNNLTIKTTGVDYDNINRTVDARNKKFDLGFKGEGYWVQGAAQVAMIDNIAVSANDAGVAVFGDTLHPKEDFRDKETIPVASLPPAIRRLIAPAGQTEVDVTDIPLRQLTGFKSYNTRDGILLWAHKTNFDGQLDFSSPEPTTAHNLRSTIDDFAVWGVRGTGVKVQYSSHTDIKDGLIIGNLDDPRGRGIFKNHASFNIDFNNLTVKGFEQGLRLEPLNVDKDFLASSISNSDFSNNVYNFAPVGGQPVGDRQIPDDFSAHFKVVNTQFAPSGGNAAPVARFSSKAAGGLAVAFDASASSDSDPLKPEGQPRPQNLESNAIAVYGWDFNNDGKIDAFGRQVSHHFNRAGAKPVTLTVWDNQGATRTLTKTVNVQPSQYVNPFADSNFSSNRPFEAGYKASSIGSELEWLASEGTRRSGGAAVLSNPSQYGSSIAQVVQDNKVHRGRQTLGLKLKNTEGAGEINNDIEISLWGINGQFNNKIYTKAKPYQAGTLPMQSKKLADITLGGQSFDWKNFQWNVDLQNGYQFLLLQVNTNNTKDRGDYVGIDNVRLFGDGTSTPTASSIPAGDNRYYLKGTMANDRLSGSARDQVLNGYDGNDILSAMEGDDSLYGGQGGDRLEGNQGRDKVYGQEGNDTLSGGEDNDSLYGGSGDDALNGWNGDDKLHGDTGSDRLHGHNGDDILYGAEGDDSLRGGRGNDSVSGAEGNDYVNGGHGDDTLSGGLGDDTIVAGSNDDILYGNEGRDELHGQNGDDTLYGSEGNDSLFSGGGNDILYGGENNDSLTGGTGNDSLNGSEGNDRLVGVNVLNRQAGVGEKDELTDWEGNNIFVLGDKNQAYYNDRRLNTAGTVDYALIKGFKQSEGNKIQLHGKASDYSIGAIPTGAGMQNGSAIYLNTPGANELIAILAYENNPNLNSSSFIYV